MKHLEQLTVEFKGSISRQKVTDGVAVKYFRNSFDVAGVTKHISSPDDLSGLVGVVTFVEKGQLGPDGKTPVVQDCFSLTSVTSITGLQNKLTRTRLEKEILNLG